VLHVLAQDPLTTADDSSLNDECVVEGQPTQDVQVQGAGDQVGRRVHAFKAPIEAQPLPDECVRKMQLPHGHVDILLQDLD
jgi:hypothetical protein